MWFGVGWGERRERGLWCELCGDHKDGHGVGGLRGQEVVGARGWGWGVGEGVGDGVGVGLEDGLELGWADALGEALGMVLGVVLVADWTLGDALKDGVELG